jgi:hypothetical protein
MVRETAATGAGVGALFEVVWTVVVVTVGVVVEVDGEDGCVCADASAAAAKKVKARDSFFTGIFSIWGRLRDF